MIYYCTTLLPWHHFLTCECVDFTNFAPTTHASMLQLCYTQYFTAMWPRVLGGFTWTKSRFTQSHPQPASAIHTILIRLVHSEEYLMQHALTDYKNYNGRPKMVDCFIDWMRMRSHLIPKIWPSAEGSTARMECDTCPPPSFASEPKDLRRRWTAAAERQYLWSRARFWNEAMDKVWRPGTWPCSCSGVQYHSSISSSEHVWLPTCSWEHDLNSSCSIEQPGTQQFILEKPLPPSHPACAGSTAL
jgi:hypothetical protein